MKLHTVLLALCLLVSAPCVMAQQDAHDAEIARINRYVAEGLLTRPEANREALRSAKANFPNDGLLIAYHEALVEYGDRLEQKKITKERYNELADMRWKWFDEANRKRHAEYAEWRQAQHAEYERQQRVMRNAAILQGIGNAFRR